MRNHLVAREGYGLDLRRQPTGELVVVVRIVDVTARGAADDATAGGHYTALFSGAFELSALDDQTIGEFLLAYRNPSGTIQLRTSNNVTSWPDAEVSSVQLDEDGGVRYPSLMGEQPSAEVGATQPYLFYTNGLSDWRTSTFMSRRVVVSLTP